MSQETSKPSQKELLELNVGSKVRVLDTLYEVSEAMRDKIDKSDTSGDYAHYRAQFPGVDIPLVRLRLRKLRGSDSRSEIFTNTLTQDTGFKIIEIVKS